MQRFNFSESIALTVENGIPTLWTQCCSDSHLFKTQLFKNSKGKAILVNHDQGSWWEREKQDAPHCEYAELWMGDFPYGSWAWTIRKCKVSGEVVVDSISTDINPRGMTQQDRFRQDCQTYVPESVTV